MDINDIVSYSFDEDNSKAVFNFKDGNSLSLIGRYEKGKFAGTTFVVRNSTGLSEAYAKSRDFWSLGRVSQRELAVYALAAFYYVRELCKEESPYNLVKPGGKITCNTLKVIANEIQTIEDLLMSGDMDMLDKPPEEIYTL